MWVRLLALYRLRRFDGDAQTQGRNWAEWGSLPTGTHSDLGTEARLLFIASVGCLARLEEQGEPQSIGVALARRKLAAQRVTDVRRRFGLSWEDADEVVELVKEWLGWALDNPLDDEPDLPWPGCVRCPEPCIL